MTNVEIVVTKCRRKSVSMKVTGPNRVEVRAPYLMPDEEIRRILEAHRAWIGKRLEMARQAAQRPPRTQAELRELAEAFKRWLPPVLEDYCARLGVTPARVTVRHQKTRWGSCSSAGGLNFNCLLALAPENVRRYVVLHEVCHLREMNHSPAFWRLVATQMPEYQEARRWLKTEGQALIQSA